MKRKIVGLLVAVVVVAGIGAGYKVIQADQPDAKIQADAAQELFEASCPK